MYFIALLASLSSLGIPLVARKELQIENESYFVFHLPWNLEMCLFCPWAFYFLTFWFLSTFFIAYRNSRSLVSAQKNPEKLYAAGVLYQRTNIPRYLWFSVLSSFLSENSALTACMVDFPLSLNFASNICLFKKHSDFPHSSKIRNGDSGEESKEKTC